MALNRLGLCLIAKNEEIDLPACLESFVPSVDHVVFVDTGSTDRTMDVANRVLSQMPVHYEIHSFTDCNDSQGRINDFSMARNFAIKQMERKDVDFIMMCDADDTLTTPEVKAVIGRKPADFYSVRYRMNDNFFFSSYKIWRNGMGVRFDGRVHEVLRVDWNRKIVDLSEVEFQHHFSTIPGQETGTERNMRILRSEIYPPLRSLFYWANENVDAQNYEEAVKWYQAYIDRVKAGEDTWSVELAHCYWRGARWRQHLGQTSLAKNMCRVLLDGDPSWSEAWCELAYIARLDGDFEKMKEYCLKALSNKFVPRLFSEIDKYTTTPANMLELYKIVKGKT